MTTHTQMSVSGLRAKVQENIPVPVLGCWIPPPRLRPGVSQPLARLQPLGTIRAGM